MSGQAVSTFEGNAYTYGTEEAIRHAKAIGGAKIPLTPIEVCQMHRMITHHNLGGSSYRTSDVMLLGALESAHIPHHSQIPILMVALCGDIGWLLNSGTDTRTVSARVMWRLVRMQPFQDGNKRTAFAVASYVMAWRDMPGVLVPNQNDCQTFVSAVVSADERTLVQLLEKWRRV